MGREREETGPLTGVRCILASLSSGLPQIRGPGTVHSHPLSPRKPSSPFTRQSWTLASPGQGPCVGKAGPFCSPLGYYSLDVGNGLGPWAPRVLALGPWASPVELTVQNDRLTTRLTPGTCDHLSCDQRPWENKLSWYHGATCDSHRSILIWALEQGSANFFCKGPDSKYFWLCSLYGVCHNYSAVPLQHESTRAVCTQNSVDVLQWKFMDTETSILYNSHISWYDILTFFLHDLKL